MPSERRAETDIGWSMEIYGMMGQCRSLKTAETGKDEVNWAQRTEMASMTEVVAGRGWSCKRRKLKLLRRIFAVSKNPLRARQDTAVAWWDFPDLC